MHNALYQRVSSESVNTLALPLSSNFFAAFLDYRMPRITAPASDFGWQISSLQITILRSVQQKNRKRKSKSKAEIREVRSQPKLPVNLVDNSLNWLSYLCQRSGNTFEPGVIKAKKKLA